MVRLKVTMVIRVELALVSASVHVIKAAIHSSEEQSIPQPSSVLTRRGPGSTKS